jgi:uncharacterized lipoprotein NlpE involved in copper resistance
MKTKLNIIPLLLLFACGQQNTNTSLSSANNSKSSLDWMGLYVGELPCADCPGIYTSVELFAQDSFSLRAKYIDKPDGNYETKGRISWNDQGSSIQLIGDEHTLLMWFKVGENKLMLLDQMGNEIESGWPDKLLLKKVDLISTNSTHKD